MNTGKDNFKKVIIDLDYIMPDTTFIYPLYSSDDEKVLEEREPLTASKIKLIKEKCGPKIFYYLPDKGSGSLSENVYKKAYNDTKSILNEVLSTEKFTRDAYKKSEELITELIEDLDPNQLDALHLLKDIRSYDEYLYNHSINVGMLTAVMARKKRLYQEKDLKSVVIGAYLCDVGKIKMEKDVLNKPDRLNSDEMLKMKLHPQMGYNILKVLDDIDPVVLQTILFHHERFDDEGYYNLPYETLPSSPKIVSICDMYDALTSPRPFRKAYTSSGALKVITNSIDKKFDRQLISDFINMAGGVLNNFQAFYRRGDFCILNSGEIAIITGFGKWDVLKPPVIVFSRMENTQGNSSLRFFQNPIEIDLAKDMNRKMDGIIMHPRLIEAIKVKLKDKKILLDYLYSSIPD